MSISRDFYATNAQKCRRALLQDVSVIEQFMLCTMRHSVCWGETKMHIYANKCTHFACICRVTRFFRESYTLKCEGLAFDIVTMNEN